MLPRLARLCPAAAIAGLFALLLNLALAAPAVADPPVWLPAPVRPAAPALMAADTFSATVLLTVSAETLTAGNPLTVTAQVVTTGTCGFAIFDVTLRGAESHFSHLDPTDNVIGPPGENPAAWRLAANQSGVATFMVEFYGETNCSGVWNWTSVRSQSQPVTVTGSRIALPLVSRNVEPLPVTDLGTLGGGSSNAVAINNRGEVAGSSTTADSTLQHAFVWRNGVMTDLGTLGGNYSWAVAINDRAQIVGSSNMQGFVPVHHAFVWADGVMTDLGTLGDKDSSASDINLTGQVIGVSETASGFLHSFIWASGVITDLGTLGGENSHAVDINDRGQAVGYSQIANGGEHAFLWQNGSMIDINPPGADSSQAKAINEHGQVVGFSIIGGKRYAFLWEMGVFADLGELAGVPIYMVYALNEQGHFAGDGLQGGNPADPLSPFSTWLWRDGEITDLGFPGYGKVCPPVLNDAGLIVIDSPTGPRLWRDGDTTPLELLSSFNANSYDCPNAINNHGQIVGSSTDENGRGHAVLWEAGEGK